MKKFCTKFNQEVEIEDVNGTPMCITRGLNCREKCEYSFAMATASKILSKIAGTEESKGTSADKGPSKSCDVCLEPTYCVDAYLLHIDSILSSDRYIDFTYHLSVKQGAIPSSAISDGISNEMRFEARRRLTTKFKKQFGEAPWIVCKSCLSMFSLNEQDKAEAKKRASFFWEGEKIEGVKVTSKKWWQFWK